MSENSSDSNQLNVDEPNDSIVTPPPVVPTTEPTSNPPATLKRKNEDTEDTDGLDPSVSHYASDAGKLSSIKRVALDSEQLDLQDKEEELQHTAPKINNNHFAAEGNEGDAEDEQEQQQEEEHDDGAAGDQDATLEPAYVPEPSTEAQAEDPASTSSSSSKPVSNHREKDDPTFVQFRMYCPVKEASTIVGKKGETISHLREKAAVRITVSENLKGVPERIVTVKGPAENVARAFGLITRVILDEPEDEPASITSQQYNLKLLIPHPLIGFIIGKQGLKFREIEENSAAKLKAAETPLPYSTDRVLSVMGVGDAIHIAVYYISQVILEHQEVLKKNKIILYNPENNRYGGDSRDQSRGGHHQQQQQQPPRHPANHSSYNNPMAYQPKMAPYGKPQHHQQQAPPPPQQQSPYNFSMMFQPSIQPQHFGSSMVSNPNPMQSRGMQPSISVPPQSQYTDEFGNTIIGEVITNPPVQAGPDKYNQDVYVANSSIGSVIGKGGNNIKHIRVTSACTYVKIEPDKGHSIMLGGGRGMTNIRKLTLTGSMNSIQTAIYLINQRINADRERNTR
ncbi:PAB1-binding protein 2 [Candida viswanathii]|uniref:PAB1-binding protein 2 n=1 Tax=Candida viswanathii TaxID=5486 RepID=A0A367YGA0_9ASCO|nr:PAB1-binding protein 2 [Candida viswanathii]